MLKKFTVFVMVLLTALVFTGCGVKTTEYSAKYPWPVILILKYELNPTTADTTDAIKNINTYLDNLTKDKNIETGVYTDDSALEIQLGFEDYETFLDFNGVTKSDDELAKVVGVKMEEKTFFYERTETFENPWKTISGNMEKIIAINEEINTASLNYTSVEYFFIFDSSMRRTSVPAAYKSENMIADYFYYFYGDSGTRTDEIVIFDRFQNDPIWYVLAVIGAGVFMVAVYLIFRGKESKAKIDIQSTDNEVK